MASRTASTSVSPAPRRPRALAVVRDPRPDEIDAPIDWSSWYLTDEEDVGESNEQSQIISVLRSVLEQLCRERGWGATYIGSDQFFAWVPGEPLVRVSPDVYLLDDPPPPPLPASWQTWRQGHRPPRFAVEVVSGDDEHPDRWRKDYEEAPEKYAQLGAAELVIFDPEAAAGRARDDHDRVALQIYRRQADGAFVRAHSGRGPAESHELGAWLVVVLEGPVARLRVARDAGGRDLVPTATEEVASLRQELDRLRGR
ncbi:MAG: Uma2 family endonuclease [Deltaproteobacteria bacterium]|nr:Uma2 family endonuclease [Deltaproteobacteria bacterium]